MATVHNAGKHFSVNAASPQDRRYIPSPLSHGLLCYVLSCVHCVDAQFAAGVRIVGFNVKSCGASVCVRVRVKAGCYMTPKIG